MRDRQLTGPWAGFAFRRGKLVSPEGHEFGPDDLRWLSLTVEIKHEWQRMMDELKSDRSERQPGVIWLRDHVAQRRQPIPEEKRRQEVVTVLRVRNRDWHAERFGSCAG